MDITKTDRWTRFGQTRTKGSAMRFSSATNSLRARTLLAFAIMLIALVVILQLLATSITGRSFHEVEERIVRDRVEQAMNAVDSSIASLQRANRDYAVWDDTYAFMLDHDLAYLKTNLGDEVLSNLGLSYIAFVDTSGLVVYAAGFDRVAGQEVAPPAELLHFDGSTARLLQHADPTMRLAGLILLADGPMLLSAEPILTSRGEGPARGTLVMGRQLDMTEIAQLAEVTRLPIAISRLDVPVLSPSLQPLAAALADGQTATVTAARDEGHILGATRIADLLSGPGVLLHLELPREIYQLGQQARQEYTLTLLGASLAFGAAVFWMLERAVLKRTVALSTQVDTINIEQPEAQVLVHGHDEIARLGAAINRLLRRLSQAQDHLIASEERYRRLIEHAPDAVIIHDGHATAHCVVS